MPASDKSEQQGEDRRLPHLTSPVARFVSHDDRQYVQKILARDHNGYREFAVPKRTGGQRLLHSPEPRLLAIQRRLLHGAVERLAPHPSAFAYRPRVSLVDCASQHLRADTVIRLDIADFFPSIRERAIFEVFLESAWEPARAFLNSPLSRLAAYQLAVLTTVSPPSPDTWMNRGTGHCRMGDSCRARNYIYAEQHEGFLPQGAPTSGALSNLVMRRADEALYQLATELGLRYTRYSDDLYFSSRRTVSHHHVDELVTRARQTLAKAGFRLNDRKMRVARRGSRRTVLSILVDGPELRLPREVHRAIDLHLRGVDRRGLQTHAIVRGFSGVAALEAHVAGLIAWSRHVEPRKGDEQQAHWQRSVQRSRATRNERPSLDLATSGDSQEHVAKESIDRLLTQGRQYRRSKDYAEFISFLGRFRTYSPFNAAMVKLQRPGARYVATDKVWVSTYRRVLKPGAQPLVMMQPGGPYMVVYDVSDTEALPGAPRLPKDVINPLAAESLLSPGRVDELWTKTADNAVRDGIRVNLVNNTPLHAGSARWARLQGTLNRAPGCPGHPAETYPLLHEIEISRHLGPLDRYVTLVHELAHLYCGHLGTPDPQQWPSRIGNRVRNEVEAESVAFIVLTRLDPNFRMGDYLLNYLGESDELPEGVGLRQIIEVATRIIKMGNNRLPNHGVGRKSTRHSTP